MAYTVVADEAIISAIAAALGATTNAEVGDALQAELLAASLAAADFGDVTAWMDLTDSVGRPVAAPVVVTFTMDMDVADPETFANDASNIPPMEVAVANLTGVDRADVTVTLTVGTRNRRLLAVRHLQATSDTYVIVSSEISVADTTEAAAVSTTITEASPEEMTAAVQAALEDADVNVAALGLNVTGASAPVTVTPAPPTAAPGGGQASGAVLSCKAFSLASLFAVSAWLLSHA